MKSNSNLATNSSVPALLADENFLARKVSRSRVGSARVGCSIISFLKQFKKLQQRSVCDLRKFCLAVQSINTSLLTIGLLSVLLFWRFKLGLTRYFDIDEFAHLHWGYSLYIGERPYTDFFYHFPPFFLYPIAGVFLLFGRSITTLAYARIFIFAIFLAVSFLILSIVKKLRGFHTALLTVVFFAFLPLPFDKMIEIRPDLFALFFAFIGLYLFISWIEKERSKYLFWSGFCYSISLGFVPKTVFFLIPPLIVLFYKFFSSISSTPGESLRATPGVSLSYRGVLWFKSLKLLKEEIGFFLLGFLPSFAILVVLLLSYGDLSISLYSIVVLTKNIHQAWASKFFIPANFSFYPNDVYYGIPGFSFPYIINLVIYLSASIFAIFRFVSFLSYEDNKKCQKEFLLATSFWANLYAFVYFYPMKHSQHLIFIAPFIVFYFTDLVVTIKSLKLLKSLRVLKLETLVILLVLFLIGWTGKMMYEKKLQWRNLSTLDNVKTLLSVIPKDEAVFDLTGKTIFFRNGYYFCCLPYGQFSDVLWIKIPSLENDIKKRNTRYVYTDQLDKLGGLPPLDSEYIKDNFVPYFPDGSLLIKK